MKDGLRRIAREQLDAAIGELTEGVRCDPVTAIHNARKDLKKERSLLRLGRRALDPGERRREAKAFRRVARGLGSARDAEVMVQALDALSDRYAGQVPEVIFAAIRERLEVQRDGVWLQLMNSPSIGDAVAQLSAARLRLWSASAGGWRAVGDGLARSYRRGRKAFRQTQAQPTPEQLHTWRKRSKDILYQLRLLEPIAPGSMRGHAKEAHHLSDLPGATTTCLSCAECSPG